MGFLEVLKNIFTSGYAIFIGYARLFFFGFGAIGCLLSWVNDNFKVFRIILFVLNTIGCVVITALITPFLNLGLTQALTGGGEAGFFSLALKFILLPVLTLLLFIFFVVVTWFIWSFLLDLFSEIRYSFWSRNVVRKYGGKKPKRVAKKPVYVNGSRYNIPIVLCGILLILECVAFFVL